MKFISITAFIFCSIFTFTSCYTKSKVEFVNNSIDATTNIIKISLSDLEKRYKSLDKKYIETEGTFFLEFENFAICSDKQFFFDERECFWLSLNSNLTINDSLLQRASGKEFILKGMVDVSDKDT